MASETDASSHEGVDESHLPWKLIAAGAIGNTMEWYDFAVYGYFAATIGKQFFPSEDATTSLIAAFGVFAAGFLMRPLGGVVFGAMGDRVGRKAALAISVLSMAIPTFLIGILPTYDQIGIAASLMLVVLRLIQGLSVGGEYTTSIVFLVESSGRNHHGFAGSWSSFGATAGILLGSAVGAVVTSIFPEEAVQSWAWRVPFLLGGLVGVVGLYTRKHLPEPPSFDADNESKQSLLHTVRHHWKSILRLAAGSTSVGVGFYIVFVYMVTYMQQVDGISEGLALEINTINMALLLALGPFAGWLSDRIGRKPIVLTSIGGLFLFSWPLFWLIHHENPYLIFLGQLGFTLLIGMSFVAPVIMVERTQREVRCTVIALGYNLSVGLLGGTAPLMATWLISRSGDDYAPAYYTMAAALVSLVVVWRLPETRDLPEI